MHVQQLNICQRGEEAKKVVYSKNEPKALGKVTGTLIPTVD